MLPDLPPYAFLDATPSDHPHPTVAAWQAHVEAGRIGRRQPTDPAILANLRAAEALFRSLRRGRFGDDVA